jgi:hypothetical protein
MFRALAILIIGRREKFETGYYKIVARTEKRLKKAFIAILIVIGMIGAVCAAAATDTSECQYAECHCFEGYDAFGHWKNDNPYNWHCTIHGDGHDCY